MSDHRGGAGGGQDRPAALRRRGRGRRRPERRHRARPRRDAGAERHRGRRARDQTAAAAGDRARCRGRRSRARSSSGASAGRRAGGARRPGAPAAGGADGADRPRGLLHDQGARLPLRRGATTDAGANPPRHHDEPRERHRRRARRSRPRGTCRRFDDSGVYMFHRNLFKVQTRPDRSASRLTSTDGGRRVGKVSDWLRDVTPLTANPSYKWNFIQEYKHPQQLYARFRGDRRAEPGDRRDRRVPNKTNGYQRKAQATIGSTSGAANQNAAVVVTSGGVGPRGRQRHHGRVRQPPGRRSAAGGRGQRPRGPRPAGQERDRRARQHGGLRSRRRSRRRVEPDRDARTRTATNAGTGIVQATAIAGRAHRLPRPEAHAARRPARSRAVRTRSRCCGSASPATAASPAC